MESQRHNAKKLKMAGTTKPIRVGGVPEHFNFPWKMANQEGFNDRFGVKVEFIEKKCGTGAMIQSLKDGEVDVIVALTEGLVADIAKGSDLRLLGTYVKSPLCWAISTGAKSKINSVEDIKGGTFGVSRMFSGSHLMACVLAGERGWDPQDDVHFKVEGDFTNLRNSVNTGATDAFMWETFTTKPFHDSGEVKRVGDITTPWPCFMLAARKETLDTRHEEIYAMLGAINESAQAFHSDKNMYKKIAQLYQLKEEDAKQWYEGVQITAERFISEAALTRVVTSLKEVGILPATLEVSLPDLLDQRFAQIKRDIKSMKLYREPELVVSLHKQLSNNGLSSGTTTYDKLLPYDQHHYHGTQAVDDVIQKLGITKDSRVINIGSGLGGPARYLAGKVGCQVLAIEIQEDLHRNAKELTERCSLEKKVHHVCGDFLEIAQHLQPGYDFVVSWLTLLHISDRTTCFKRAKKLLRPGGIFYAADFFQKKHLTHDEWKVLHDDIACTSLAASLQAYKFELGEQGFKVEAKDVTEDWAAYTRDRVVAFGNNTKLKSVIGPEIHSNLLKFYSVVANLYANGNLGGCEIIAKKPLGW